MAKIKQFEAFIEIFVETFFLKFLQKFRILYLHHKTEVPYPEHILN